MKLSQALLLLGLLHFHCLCSVAKAERKWNNTISAIYVFGDSTVDPGNNNFINTAFKSNFPPYGEDLPNHVPTGRFCNGRLTTDFIGSYIGLKDYIPPYLDPTLSIQELRTGVSFASAGSGFDPLTASISNVISIPTQLEHFKEYKKRMESTMGKEKLDQHIKKSVFIISAGTNDYIVNYFSLPIRKKTYTISAYQQFVLQNAKNLVQELRKEGAVKIIVSGLPPMGCLPAVITLYSDNSNKQRGCVDMYSSVARQYNSMLQNEVNFMNLDFQAHGAKIYFIDIYGPLNDMILSPAKLGFDEVNSGCCGTGFLEAAFLCNPTSYVCPDASKYVFWDSIHPTEKTYYGIFKHFVHVIDDIINDS